MQQRILLAVEIAGDENLGYAFVERSEIEGLHAAARESDTGKLARRDLLPRREPVHEPLEIEDELSEKASSQRLCHPGFVCAGAPEIELLGISLPLPASPCTPATRLGAGHDIAKPCHPEPVVIVEAPDRLVDSRHAHDAGNRGSACPLMAMGADRGKEAAILPTPRMFWHEKIEGHPNLGLDHELVAPALYAAGKKRLLHKACLSLARLHEREPQDIGEPFARRCLPAPPGCGICPLEACAPSTSLKEALHRLIIRKIARLMERPAIRGKPCSLGRLLCTGKRVPAVKSRKHSRAAEAGGIFVLKQAGIGWPLNEGLLPQDPEGLCPQSPDHPRAVPSRTIRPA